MKKADSRYLYTPYEITELPVGYRKETPFADSMLKAKDSLEQETITIRQMETW